MRFQEGFENEGRLWNCRKALKLNGNSKRVFLGGFSQGASVALAVYLKYELDLGGVVCI